MSSAITLRREMLEAIQYKFPSVHVDDLQWPLMTSSGSPLPRKKPNNARQMRLSSAEEASDSENDFNPSMKAYWDSIVKEHAEQAFDVSSLSASDMSHFPPHWTIVHISLTPDKSTLFISRQNVSSEPLMFSTRMVIATRRLRNEKRRIILRRPWDSHIFLSYE
jgi:separase